MSQTQPQITKEKVDPTNNPNRKLILWAAALSALAVIAHAIDAPDHLTEWWGFATFFVVVGSIQFFYGLVLFFQPWKYDNNGGVRPNPEYYGRTFYVLGLVLSASLIAVYVISRTTGLTFIAADAIPKSVSILSLIPSAENLPLLYCLSLLLIRTSKLKPGSA